MPKPCNITLSAFGVPSITLFSTFQMTFMLSRQWTKQTEMRSAPCSTPRKAPLLPPGSRTGTLGAAGGSRPDSFPHEASDSAVTQSIGGYPAISKWTEPALSGVYSASFGREAPVGGKVNSLTCAGRKARAGLQGESEQVQTMGPPRGRERGWKEGHVAGRRG